MKAHAHAHAPQHKELWHIRFKTNALTQAQELAQGVWAIEHPHPRIRDRLQYLAPPLVDKVRWRDDQRARMRLLHQCCCADGHHGFTRAHLRIQHSSWLIVIHQELDAGLNGLCLLHKRFAPQRHQGLLASLPDSGLLVQSRLIHRRMLHSHLIEQALAKLTDEVTQCDGFTGHIRQVVLAIQCLSQNFRGSLRGSSGWYCAYERCSFNSLHS